VPCQLLIVLRLLVIVGRLFITIIIIIVGHLFITIIAAGRSTGGTYAKSG
jgi:hypothetical protein